MSSLDARTELTTYATMEKYSLLFIRKHGLMYYAMWLTGSILYVGWHTLMLIVNCREFHWYSGTSLYWSPTGQELEAVIVIERWLLIEMGRTKHDNEVTALE